MKNSYFWKWKCHKGGERGGQKSAKKVSRIIWMAPYKQIVDVASDFAETDDSAG